MFNPDTAAKYKLAFSRCYPQKRLEIRSHYHRGQWQGYKIIIDGEAGDISLSEMRMHQAIEGFLQ